MLINRGTVMGEVEMGSLLFYYYRCHPLVDGDGAVQYHLLADCHHDGIIKLNVRGVISGLGLTQDSKMDSCVF